MSSKDCKEVADMTVASEEIKAMIRNLKEKTPELQQYDDSILLFYVEIASTIIGTNG